MAGDWLKFEKSTSDKPEVFEMAQALGIEADAVVGKLLRVWSWFDDHTEDGNAPVTLRALLDRYAGVTGFVTEMERVGWILIDGDRMILPKFDRHNGKTAKTRALAKNRAESHRVKSNAKSNASSVTNALPEKRREEDKSVQRARPIDRPSVEQAMAAAPMAGVTPEEAEEWWTKREATDWMRSLGGDTVAPVGANWRADMKQFTISNRERRENEKHRKNHGGGNRRVDRNANNLNAGTASDYKYV